jgi:hypothetical protein
VGVWCGHTQPDAPPPTHTHAALPQAHLCICRAVLLTPGRHQHSALGPPLTVAPGRGLSGSWAGLGSQFPPGLHTVACVALRHQEADIQGGMVRGGLVGSSGMNATRGSGMTRPYDGWPSYSSMCGFVALKADTHSILVAGGWWLQQTCSRVKQPDSRRLLSCRQLGHQAGIVTRLPALLAGLEYIQQTYRAQCNLAI